MIRSEGSVRWNSFTLIRVDFYAAFTCWSLIVFFLCCGGREALAASRQIQYLQVEANEGNSSGGHTAIRFDKDTFHFQHENSGLIRIKRLDSKSFDHIYAVLGNRAIQESWIDVSEETYAQLLDEFNQFLIIQDEQMDILDTLSRDVALFTFLLERMNGTESQAKPISLPFKGIGYFLSDEQFSVPAFDGRVFTDSDFSQSSPALADLKAYVKSTYGDNYIEQRIDRARETLRTIKLVAVKPSVPGLSADFYPVSTNSASSSYDDAIMAFFALQLLQYGPKLMPGSYWSSADPVFILKPEERILLRSFAAKLTDDLLCLVNSSRSDWGFPFIVGMARLASIEVSLESGRLVFLDVFPETGLLPQASKSLSGRRYLPAMRQETEKSFLAKRKEFFAVTETLEADYAALELVGNGLMDLDRSMEGNLQTRGLPENMIPSRLALLAETLLPDMSESDLKRELEAAVLAQKDYAKALSTLYGYDLFHRNCVTEIFAFINKGLMRHSVVIKQNEPVEAMSHAEKIRQESMQRLGGYVDVTQGLNFIPAVSAAEVDACYSVTAKREQPSYRSAQLAEMKKHESSLLVFLRESNTVTSTIYHRPPNDSPFLFFTDDTVLLRPVFGVFNLLVGVGESLVGLATMPVEGTNRLYLGAKGILFSLPELVFINLRKGTMEYVAADQ